MTITSKHPVLLWMLLCIAANAHAQTGKTSEEQMIAELMERYIENTASDADYTDLQEQLTFYLHHKINLNKAESDQLQSLVFLNETQITAILEHRRIFGDLITLYELQSIEALDDRTIYLLTFFTTVFEDIMADQTSFSRMLKEGRHEMMALHDREFEQRAGYAKDRLNGYKGSPFRYVARYRFTYSNKLYFGYTGEKDMGEPFRKDGFDFQSFHFFYHTKNRFIKTIALGDYQANFGQGLTFASGMAGRKSAYTTAVKRNFQPLRPYRSLNENEFLRGAAVTVKVSSVTLTSFFSHKAISTNYKDDSLNTEASFSSIGLTGLHRTASEIASRKNVIQTVYGFHASWKASTFEIGTTASHTSYNNYFAKGDKPYQLYNFNGRALTNAGMDYSWQLRNILLFGEYAYSFNKAWAFTSGAMVPLDANLDLTVLYRRFSEDYQAAFSNAFAENNDGRNEEGLYAGLSLKLTRKWLLNAYADMYKSRWLRYLTDAPSSGTDQLAELQFNASKNVNIYLRYHHERKEKNLANNTSAVDFLSPATRETIRFHSHYKLSDTWNAASRIEHATWHDVQAGYRYGMMIFQDLSYTTPRKKCSISTRVALFHTDDYNTRLYATETDVLYQYAVPLFQNSGIRYYAVLHFKLNKRADVWIKYAQTTYSNVTTIGSGLEEISGNKQSDLRVQMRLVL